MDKDGPLAKAPRNEDIVVGATALFLSGVRWFRAMEEAKELYYVADRLVETKYRPILFEGAESALRELRRVGLRLGIATNGSGAAARGIMGSLELEGLFDAIVGADDVGRGKPAPDMILLACERAEVEPGVSVYVGDAPADMMAGRAAGCGTLVAVNNVDDEELTRAREINNRPIEFFRTSNRQYLLYNPSISTIPSGFALGFYVKNSPNYSANIRINYSYVFTKRKR